MSNSDQNDFPLPIEGGDNKRRSTDLLPRYFRTQANKKILSSTLDQMVQPGVAEKIDGYYGRRTAKAFRPGDTYIEDVSKQRQDRQLEPATVVKDDLNNVEFYSDYPDFINQIAAFSGDVSNQSKLNTQEYYAWNPNVDWDKLANFREYFWLPNGPETVVVAGQSKDITSTYKVTSEDTDEGTIFKFSNRLAANPTLTLYRGQTYRFEINAPDSPFAFTVDSTYTTPNPEFEEGEFTGSGESENISSRYIKGQKFFDNQGNEVEPGYIDIGVIEFTVPNEAPDELFYLSESDINTQGFIKVFNIEENTAINIEEEILGKVAYNSANGVEFTNGLKVKFIGEVEPVEYATGEWYVEGVGSGITLINEADLVIPAAYADDVLVPFSSEPWDRLPFSNASSFASTKDYIVINRSSQDRNAWSRYNKWFHSSVIEAAARYNGETVNLDLSARATRPIIEFEPGLRLFNYGTSAKKDVDLVDTFTKDVFSTIEGSLGYNIDETQVVEGMRILFTADTDRLVNGKIYRVTFLEINGNRQISLREEPDVEPLENETVLVKNGAANRGSLYWFDGEQWNKTQEKTATNQAPRFQLYDSVGDSFIDPEKYVESTFTGTTIFEYIKGTGSPDPELGFPIKYRTIENVGDIQFNFSLVNSEFTYIVDDRLVSKSTDIGYLRKYTSLDDYTVQNGWAKAYETSSQVVERQYITDEPSFEFEIDMYDNSSSIEDLTVAVYLNQERQVEDVDYFINRDDKNAVVTFYRFTAANDSVILKTRTSQAKNNNGKYEMAHNLERNPLNNKITEFTLGEVNDHVDTITENIRGFTGSFPGPSNLRDLGDLDPYGKRFVQHSGPLNLANYHITDRSANIIKAIRYSKSEYSKFKREMLQQAENLGFDGTPRQQLDLIMRRINSSKTSTMPFYFSDMVCAQATRTLRYEVPADNNNFYALTTPFTLDELSASAVMVYLNGRQIVHGIDYVFTQEGFVDVKADIQKGDLIEIVECEVTDGSYVPATPTKLGLYPAYVPQKFLDTTYREPVNVIQGHDGSIVVAFDDYRDDIILEFELRVYNNLKQKYNKDLFDMDDFVPGDFRTTGYSKESIDRVMIKDFVDWVTIAGDPEYTNNTLYNRTNSFTFNYTGTVSPSGVPLNGYWRSVYSQAYDTTRPHTHPWEMLGFTVMPTWWTEEYGPAPYTSNNLVMWRDIAEGRVKEPGKPQRILEKYKRPTLLNHLPVGASGELLSPFASGYARNYVDRLGSAPYKFGDHSPAESAWRRGSEYPFSLLTARVLNQPNTTFATGYDISRIQRNQVGQLIYTKTGKALRLQDIAFPNVVSDSKRVTTSGLVNFVFDYLSSSVLLSYNTYKDQLSRVKNQLRLNVGGYTEKEKFNLILDSRTPFNQGNVFLPKENYQVFLNTSSPIDVASYSGVVIEKTASGFVVKGYDKEDPVFRYTPPIVSSSDPVINIGGVSEPFLEWSDRKQYIKGQNVRYNNLFYRVTTSHVSTDVFNEDNFRRQASLPQVGGRNAVLRRNFQNREVNLTYGTLLPDVQAVVDFLLGYEQSLIKQGFVFDFFNKESTQVENWTYSVKEFLFWTTQNWAAGSVITLSPGADQIKFERDFAVVDDIFDNFYDYSLLSSTGKRLEKRFSSVARSNENEFGIRSINTADGIFNVKLPLVQKEHVILIDNRSEFDDVIYELETGYRQERIRVIGYRSDNWNGGLDIPGFIYDSAEIEEWEPWTDYAIGALVKYKEFFYVAVYEVPGNDVFVSGNWERLDNRPEAKLIPNFEYRINQFADFYDLDTDNFDVEQQKHAQHLIGYQKRQFLQNIINDDVSQYKFYQGYIQDKGTRNALTKLFDALNSADRDSLEFYEEWAIRLGRYGDTDNSKVVEFLLDESKFRLTPQPVELTNNLPIDPIDLVYRQTPNDIYAAPEGYNSKPFEVAKEDPFVLRSSGYVNSQDVSYRVSNADDVLAGDPGAVDYGIYIWNLGLNEEWDVLQHVRADVRVTDIAVADNIVDADGNETPAALITFNTNTNTLENSQYIGLQDVDPANVGFYKIAELGTRTALVEIPPNLDLEPQEDIDGFVSTFRSVRSASIAEANEIVKLGPLDGQRLWIDGDSFNNWQVLEHNEIYSEAQEIINPETEAPTDTFATAISVTVDNRNMVVGESDNGNGVVRSYTRPSDTKQFTIDGGLRPSREVSGSIDSGEEFGKSVALSPDGRYLAIGSPGASNIASPLVGAFDPDTVYDEGDVVKFAAQYWSANRTIDPQIENITFDTFNSYAFIEKETDSSLITLLLQGAPYVTEKQVDHLLVRAPIDQYRASIDREQALNDGLTDTVKVDKVYLNWNSYTNLNRTDSDTSIPYTAVEPFEDVNTDIAGTIDAAFLSQPQGHEIVKKIDNILYIQSAENLPSEGDTVTTTTGQGVVYKRFQQSFSLVVYLTEVQGVIAANEVLFNQGETIGSYTQPAFSENPELGGYWYIETPTYTNAPEDTAISEFGITGYGLVYQDFLKFRRENDSFDNPLESEPRDNIYPFYNILDTVNEYGTDLDRSFIINLSYRGDVQGNLTDNADSRWLIRLPVTGDYALDTGDSFSIWVNDSLVGDNIEDYGFDYDYINGTDVADPTVHTITDVWEGYVDFTFTATQATDVDGDGGIGDFFEPDGSLGVNPAIVRDNVTEAEAEVVFYQKRNINQGRIYLKNVTGEFVVNDILRVKTFEAGTENVRTVGDIDYVSLSSSTLGKLAVIDKGSDFPVDPATYNNPFNDFALVNGEYWFYDADKDLLGASQPAKYPFTGSRDWTQVQNVPVSPNKPRNALEDQGAFSIYERLGNAWQWVNTYILPETTDGSRIAKNLKFAKQDNLYRLFVATSKSTDSSAVPGSAGRIYVIKNGVDADGDEFDWALDVDPNYRGPWSEVQTNISFTTGDIVEYNQELYRAKTVVSSDKTPDTDTAKWELLDEQITVESFVPHLLTEQLYQDSTFTDGAVSQFAVDLATSANGQILATTVYTDLTDSFDNDDNRVLIYRIKDKRYVLDQIIDTPTLNVGFGDSISMSPNGRYLAIGVPYDDSEAYNQGKVYVYKQVNGKYSLVQILSAPSTSIVERFGTKVSVTDTTISVASFNGDIELPTTFDVEFDQGFTTFSSKLVDTGSVTIYELVGDTFLYSDELEYTEASSSEFGENLLAVRNHVYVGIPRRTVNNTRGLVVDYIRDRNSTAWTVRRKPLPVVDVNQVKEVYLFDKRTNQLITYLDYLDVRQGKIPGPAAQEVDYRYYADPARYNISNEATLFDDTNNWAQAYVGKVWWDLSTARFANPYQGDSIFQSTAWNQLLPGASIDIYEWVESTLLPSDWDALADTNQGVSRGISGQSRYGNDVYSQALRYDSVAGNFSNVYYFWVRNKFTVPNIETRTLSAGDIANLIADPYQQGYQFVALTADNRFVVYNADSLIAGTNTVLAVNQYTLDIQEQNVHLEYQLLSEGLDTSMPKKDIERKWIDSLVGYDEVGRIVPDPDLSPRQRYGTLFRPRQSWFVNRKEALKQVVERANISLASQPIVDSRDLSKLLQEDPLPTAETRLFDYEIDTIEELRFIGTSKAATATLEPTVVNGQVVDVDIVNPGRRYQDSGYEPGAGVSRRGPSVTITGNGSDLEIELTINNLGVVTGVDIVDPGQGYSDDLRLTVRPVSVLVKSDSTIGGRWAIYALDVQTGEWQRTSTQDYDVKRYWTYADWYAEGENQFTLINRLVDQTYQIPGLDDEIGDVVKVASVGTGGWLLLRKVNDVDTTDITVNYETIGRENGTVELSSLLFDNSAAAIGFDVDSYDGRFFDAEPSTEIRLIMQALKEDLLVDDLAVDYNALFFTSIRYVFSEQQNVDWAFKTSFVKAKHNVGQLDQEITFQNNTLPSYNDYVEEVKPYKTNVREYVSALEKLEESGTLVTDFDLPPRYVEEEGKILPRDVKIIDNQLVGLDDTYFDYPTRNWLDNVGFKVVEIQVYDGGSLYTSAPPVTITGGGGAGATAKAFVANGKVRKIQVLTAGNSYGSRPTVEIGEPANQDGRRAQATAIIGDSVVRSMRTEVKFDRISGTASILALGETQTLTGTAVNTKFNLTWPMDLKVNTVKVTIDGTEALRSEYTYTNIVDNSLSYTRYHGQIEFASAPALDAVIVVEYQKDPSLFNAAERINFYYEPTAGMIGNETSQLMTGVDYGGVEVRSFDFDTSTGWDNDAWATSTWDTYDTTYEDLVFQPDGSTTLLELSSPLEDGVTYNVYRDNVNNYPNGVTYGAYYNAVRIDDPEFDLTTELSNKNAEMPSLVGDGQQTLIDLDEWDISADDGDIFIIRKTTSDGSLLPDATSYDTQLDGGDLDYGNATGLNAEDIIVDGDLFVTPITSGGPEELVPGQVLDTVDVRVFERVGDGQGEIFNQNYVTDGVKDTFALGIKPNSLDAVIVKLDNIILPEDDYTINFEDNTVTLNTTPSVGSKLTILTVGLAGNDVLDIGTFVGDGTTKVIETAVAWRTDLSSFITVNGIVPDGTGAVVEEGNGVAVIRFASAPKTGEVVDYALFVEDDEIDNYSRVLRDTFVGDESTVSYPLTQAPGAQEPAEFFMLVNVNNEIKRPGYNKQFIVETVSIVDYQFDTFQIPEFTIDPAQVRVFVDGTELARGSEFVVTIASSSIRLDPTFIYPGAVIEAYYTDNADYFVTGSDIQFTGTIPNDSVIDVYQFTNHDVVDIERISYDVVSRSNLTPGTDEFTTYHNLRGGKIFLRDPAAGVQYVWVSKNGILLSPTVDYTLSLDRRIVYLVEDPAVDDFIDVFHFAAPVRTPRLAWSKFKDILNRTHYKRIDNDTGQVLAQPLNEYDLRIEVNDATELSNPDKVRNRPGIIFIDGERIEYFIKDGNTLRQLRRGTLGTGVKETYPAGTIVTDMSSIKNIPYKDVFSSQKIVNDGSSATYETNFNLSGFTLKGYQNWRDFFEVFVGGRRLRKNAVQEYQFDMVDEDGNIVQAIAPDSPAGDIEVEKEFDIIVDPATKDVTLQLTEVPDPEETIMMVRKTGSLWSPQGTTLKDADNSIGNFLRGSISKLPE